MNDFTKAELFIILQDMIFYASQSKPINESPIHGELREKIEDMIDNFCKHEPDGHIYELQPEYRCKKCGEFFI